MAVMDQLASLLLTAERASSKGTVTIDLFPRSDDPAGGGELVPLWAGPSPLGRLVAERGRVCWVMAKGCDVTVSDLLAEEAGIPRDQLERVYEVASSDGQPFCETLAQVGLVSPEDVRKALLRRTAAGAAALARVGVGEDVVMSVARIPSSSYDTQFTYAALEILEAVASSSDEWHVGVGELPDAYRAGAEVVASALCFRESQGNEMPIVPIASHSKDPLPLGAALDLAVTALAQVRSEDPLNRELAPYPVIPGERGEGWLAAHAPPYLCLFQVGSAAEYRRVLGRLIFAPHRGE